MFPLPVFEKSAIFSDFRAIAHSICAGEGGNTVCWKAMARKRTVDNSMTYWFPWKHLWQDYGGQNLAFWSDTTKNWLVVSAIRASPLKSPKPKYRLGPSGLAISSMGAFPRKQPKCQLCSAGLAFRAQQMPRPHFFARSMSASWSTVLTKIIYG